MVVRDRVPNWSNLGAIYTSVMQGHTNRGTNP